MKTLHILFLLIFSLAMVHNASSGIVEKVYHFDSPSISVKGNYHTLAFANTLMTGLPGEPVLPYQAVKLLLPPGEKALSIELEWMDEMEIPGNYAIYPQQHVRPVSEGASGGFACNKAVYSSSGKYPVDASGELITSYLNGHAFGLASFTPVRYIPATGKVTYFRNVRVIIHTAPASESAAALQNLRNGTDISETVLRMADNPELAETYVPDSRIAAGDYQILIITSPEYSGAFESLKQDYLQEGLITQVITTQEINTTMTGIDLQEKMRNYIIQEYQQHGIQHVILGGDDELIPNRGFYCFVQSSSAYEDYSIPSDLYYSALDGNWNTDGDNMWGEPGEDDLLPDISVGRLSFSNMFELNRMLFKSHRYQFAPVPGEFRKVILAGENLYYDPETWGSDYLELLVGSHDDNGYSTTGIPEDHTFNKMYDETTYWSGYDLINQVNQGFPMLHHSGHANETYVMKLSNWDITDQNFSGANGVNHNYVLVYTHGCLCGSFDFSDCIAEQMVSINNFAVAFVGNSRYGWFNEGQTEGPSAHLHREFLDALYSDKYNRLGRAHMESKIATAPWVTAPGQWEPGALRWCFYDCNVLGDPLLAVWTDNAFSMQTSYPSIIQTGSTGINVNVTSGGIGVNGLTCAFLMNGELLGTTTTDETGSASVTFDSPVLLIGTAQLVISGYNCLPTVYPVTVSGTIGQSDVVARADGISVVPNPVTGDFLTIRYELFSADLVSISIIGQDGKIVPLKEKQLHDYGTHSNSFEVKHLAPGVYECVVTAGSRTMTARFVKK